MRVLVLCYAQQSTRSSHLKRVWMEAVGRIDLIGEWSGCYSLPSDDYGCLRDLGARMRAVGGGLPSEKRRLMATMKDRAAEWILIKG